MKKIHKKISNNKMISGKMYQMVFHTKNNQIKKLIIIMKLFNKIKTKTPFFKITILKIHLINHNLLFKVLTKIYKNL